MWFGNESKGVSEEAVETADVCIRIPMRGIVESLNLGTSTRKVRFKPKGLGKLKMQSWQDFIERKD